MDAGIIETIAHYAAAKHISKKFLFILDIGGQDMKAIFVNDGVINRIEINEACSSGCGSLSAHLRNRWITVWRTLPKQLVFRKHHVIWVHVAQSS